MTILIKISMISIILTMVGCNGEVPLSLPLPSYERGEWDSPSTETLRLDDTLLHVDENGYLSKPQDVGLDDMAESYDDTLWTPAIAPTKGWEL